MTAGIRFRDSSGAILYTIGESMSAYVGYVDTVAGTPGNVTDSTLGLGTPFYMELVDSVQSGGRKGISFAGTTLSWDGAGGNSRIVYGIKDPDMSGSPLTGANFRVKYSGAKVLDRRIAKLVNYGKLSGTSSGGNAVIDVGHTGGVPAITVWTANAAFMLLSTLQMSGFTRYIMHSAGAVSWECYTFGTVPSSTPSGRGLRLRDASGNVTFDSRYKLCQVHSDGYSYALADYTSDAVETMASIGSGRKAGVLIGNPGYATYGAGGPIKAVGIITSGDTAQLQSVTFGSNSSPVPVDFRLSSRFAVIDLTGI